MPSKFDFGPEECEAFLAPLIKKIMGDAEDFGFSHERVVNAMMVATFQRWMEENDRSSHSDH